MNTALSNTDFTDYRTPAKGLAPSLKPIPRVDDLDDDIQLFRVLDSPDYMPVPGPLTQKRHPVLDVDRMVVSTSLIRRIEYELRHDVCDPRTVFNYCRGMARNSLEFQDTYVAARIRSFAKHQRIVTDPFLVNQTSGGDRIHHPFLSASHHHMPAPPHPMAVNHLGHLMRHLGIWVIALLGIQVWSSWRISAYANTYLEGGRPFYFAVVLFLILALNSAIWFRRRGHLCDAFLIPGAALFLMALLPILTLHVREILLSMR